MSTMPHLDPVAAHGRPGRRRAAALVAAVALAAATGCSNMTAQEQRALSGGAIGAGAGAAVGGLSGGSWLAGGLLGGAAGAALGAWGPWK